VGYTIQVDSAGLYTTLRFAARADEQTWFAVTPTANTKTTKAPIHEHRLQAPFGMISDDRSMASRRPFGRKPKAKLKIRTPTESPSLSYLTIYIAVKKGLFASAASTWK